MGDTCAPICVDGSKPCGDTCILEADTCDIGGKTLCETVSPTIMLHVDSIPYVSLPILDIPLTAFLTPRHSTVISTRVRLCNQWVREEREIAR
jgi:hypothetical protein